MSMATSLIGFDLLRDHQVQVSKELFDKWIGNTTDHTIDSVRYLNDSLYKQTNITKGRKMKIKNLVKILKQFDQNMDVQFMVDSCQRSLTMPAKLESLEIAQFVCDDENEEAISLTVPVLNLTIKE